MSESASLIRLESDADNAAIETLVWSVFGPGMTARAAYVLREDVPHEMPLSFVAEREGMLIGTVRLTQILIGGKPVLMLGPLAVEQKHKNLGIGRQLMQASMDAAHIAAKDGGPACVMLVGDHPYYAPFGFLQVPAGSITLPRPADPSRILVCPLTKGASVSGKAERLFPA